MNNRAISVFCLIFLAACNDNKKLDGHCTNSLSSFQDLVGGWKTISSVVSTSGHNIRVKKDDDDNWVIAAYDDANSRYCIQFSSPDDKALIEMLLQNYHPPLAP